MDDREFRRLCLDALHGRLADTTRVRWEAHRRANPRCARFYADLAAAEAALDAQLPGPPPENTLRASSISNRAAPPLAPPADEDDAARLQTRRLAYWAPVAVLVGVLAAGVGALLVIGPTEGMKGKSFTITLKNEAPADTPSGQPEPPPEEIKKPHGEAKKPPVKPPPTELEKPPVKPPPVEPEKPPAQPPPVEPEKPPAQPPFEPERPQPVAAVSKVSGKSVRFRVQGLAGAGKVHSGPVEVRRGDRVRVLEGALTLEVDGLRAQAFERAESRLVTSVRRPLQLRLDYGEFVLDGLALEAARVVEFEHATLEFTRAVVVVQTEWGRSTLYVLQGEVALVQDKVVTGLAAGDSAAIEPGRVSTPAAENIDWAALDDRWLGPRRILLREFFEDGIGPFETGKWLVPGARKSKGALAWDRIRAGVGSGEAGFVATDGARLRFRVKTNSPQLRVHMQVQADGKWINAMLALTMRSSEWELIDVPLSELRGGPANAQPAFHPGAEYRALHFKYRYPDNRVLPSERFLYIDDVEVYVPGG